MICFDLTRSDKFVFLKIFTSNSKKKYPYLFFWEIALNFVKKKILKLTFKGATHSQVNDSSAFYDLFHFDFTCYK